MTWLTEIMAEAAPLIIEQFPDICDLKRIIKKNVDGQMVEDPTKTIEVFGIRCAFEPWRMHSDPILQLPVSELVSAGVTHKILMLSSADTVAITQEYFITIRAREWRPVFRFVQPIRLDESLSPIVIVGAMLQNQ